MTKRPVFCTLESRRADVMIRLIEAAGATPVSAPALMERPLLNNEEAAAALRKIVDGSIDGLICLTGVGVSAVLRLADELQLLDPLIRRLKEIPVIARGPKPTAVLRAIDVRPTLRVADPYTTDELLQALDESGQDWRSLRFGLQEYGRPEPDLLRALEQRFREVTRIPVYRWDLPADTAPLKSACRKIIAGEIQALLLTSAQQFRHLMQTAETMQQVECLHHSLQNLVLASIGPTCSDAIREFGLEPSLEASPPKMAALVTRTAQHFHL